MDRAVKVAVVRSDNRRGAVAQALALIADDLRAIVAPRVLIKPNLVSHRSQLPSTHADTLSATLDALFAAGAEHALVAEGASDARAGFEHLGHRRECWNRPVGFFDINRDESEWLPLELNSIDGTPLAARLSRTVAEADCRVSLALAKTHVTAIVTLGLKNMLSSIHPDDRIMMHGQKGGNGYHGWKRAAVEFLKGDNLLVNVLTRSMGRVRNLKNILQHKNAPDAWRHLAPAELHFLRTVGAMNRNLVALTRRVKPDLSVVDGFLGMHREGPRHGTPIGLGTVIAGTDALAVDAVAAAVMGFDPNQIGYLALAGAAGLGTIDLDAISIVGDPIERVRRRFVPHSNHAIQRHWERLADLDRPSPHVRRPRPEKVRSR